MRLTALKNALLDSLIQPGRYAVHRHKITTELQEIDHSLAQTTLASRPEFNELFAILDIITWNELDEEGWRELLETLVDRAVITDRDVAVKWLPICQPLLAMSARRCTRPLHFSNGTMGDPRFYMWIDVRYRAVQPPSTISRWPVVVPADGLAR